MIFSALSFSNGIAAETLAIFHTAFHFLQLMSFISGVSGRLKQMVRSLLPSRPVHHLCPSQLKRTGSSPTLLMC